MAFLLKSDLTKIRGYLGFRISTSVRQELKKTWLDYLMIQIFRLSDFFGFFRVSQLVRNFPTNSVLCIHTSEWLVYQISLSSYKTKKYLSYGILMLCTISLFIYKYPKNAQKQKREMSIVVREVIVRYQGSCLMHLSFLIGYQPPTQ